MKTLDASVVQSRELKIQPLGIFAGLELNDLHALEQAGEWLETDGDMIIQDGCEQNYLYLVVSGKVEVFKYNKETKKKQVLATLGENACMGEIAFLRGDVASANVKALKATVLWRIDHSTLQQYISEYPGGGQLCLNLADVLAQRVQEGNTRLVGVTQSLSAYFGQMARQNEQKDIEAPLAAGMADMEVPRELYDRFVCETMEYPEGSILGDEHRQYVDELVKSNQTDFIGWLESGQREQKLKIILKFVPLDAHGNVILTDDDDTEEDETPATSQGEATPTPVRRQPRRAPRAHIVSVPQVQARVKSHTAVIKEEPDRIWQAIHYGAYILLPFVTALTILKFLPLESRIGIADNGTYQAIPGSGVVNMIMFQPSDISIEGRLGKELTFENSFNAPDRGHYSLSLELESPLMQASSIHIKLYDSMSMQMVIDKAITLQAGETRYQLDDLILGKSQYRFKIESSNWRNETSAPATFRAKGRH